MKHGLAVGVLSTTLLLAFWSPTWADALQEVLAAHSSGQDTSELAILKPLADGGDPAAQFKLGVMNSRGWAGTSSPNYAEAGAWYQKSADQGFMLAEAALGSLYFNGWGRARDNKMARYWWEKAAAQGDKPVIHNLAVLDAMER